MNVLYKAFFLCLLHGINCSGNKNQAISTSKKKCAYKCRTCEYSWKAGNNFGLCILCIERAVPLANHSTPQHE